MTDPIALFLPVFAVNPIGELDMAAPPAMTMPEPSFLEDEIVSVSDGAEERIAQARDEALAEAAIATEAALVAQAAELENRHADVLAEERRRWVEEEGARLADQLRTGLSDLERLLAESVVEILQPFVEKAVRAKTAEDLREAITQVIANAGSTVLRISGPSDLVEPLRGAFPEHHAIEFTDALAPEVTVEAGDTTIRTQLQSWASTLERHFDEVG